MKSGHAITTGAIDSHAGLKRIEVIEAVPEQHTITADTEMAGMGRGIGALVGGGAALCSAMYIAKIFFGDAMSSYVSLMMFAAIAYFTTFLGGIVGDKVMEWVTVRERGNSAH